MILKPSYDEISKTETASSTIETTRARLMKNHVLMVVFPFQCRLMNGEMGRMGRATPY